MLADVKPLPSDASEREKDLAKYQIIPALVGETIRSAFFHEGRVVVTFASGASVAVATPDWTVLSAEEVEAEKADLASELEHVKARLEAMGA
jgi:hypothetical protein